MDIERRLKVPERRLTPAYLTRRLERFSNGISAGRWRSDETAEISISRSLTEQFGEVIEGDEAETLPIRVETTIEFHAEKTPLEYAPDSFVMAPQYTLRSSVSQEVLDDELPPNVIDEILREANGDDDGSGVDVNHPLYEIMDSIDKEGPFSREDFEAFDINCTQETEYEIDCDGEIQDYSTSVSYSIDDIVIHDVGYVRSLEQFQWTPTIMRNGIALERRPISVTELSSERILREVDGIDTEFEAFLMEKSLKELTEFAGVPREEHIRRIIGMIGILSSGRLR